MRSHLSKIIVGLAIVSFLVPCSIQAGASAHKSEPITADNGAQILAVSLRAAAREGSCSNFTSSVTAGFNFGDLTNSGTGDGEEFVTYKLATIDVRFLDGVVYVKANGAGILEWYGVSDPALASKWVEVPATSADYSSFLNDVPLTSLLKELRPAGTLKVTPVATISKHRVVGVTGQPNALLGFSSGLETLYVSTAYPYLPVELTVTGNTTGSVSGFHITFTNWGSHIEVIKPRTATSIFKTTLSNHRHVTLR